MPVPSGECKAGGPQPDPNANGPRVIDSTIVQDGYPSAVAVFFLVHICISETTVFLDFQKTQNSIDPVDMSDGQTNENLWQKQTWRGITTSTNGAFGSEAPKMKRRANVENPSATYPSFTSGSGSTLESKTWARHRPTKKSI